MDFLTYLHSILTKKTPILGANLDTRSPEAKARDYHISEVVASATPVNWVEMAPGSVRAFPVQDQSQKSDCVAESRRKLKRIIFKVNRDLDLDFSSAEFYRRRKNYPNPGMGSDDAISLDRNSGMTLDALVPSEVLKSEDAVNALTLKPYNADIAKVFSSSNEVTFTPGDFQTPAGTIQVSRKGIMAWYYFTAEEWSREVPVVLKYMTPDDSSALRHSVVAVEPALYNGVKGWWIEDSAHFAGLSRRFITEDFHKARNFWLSYPINFKFEEGLGGKPSYDGSVKSLQDCLRYEGIFPANIDSTGVYGPITIQAVKDFQAKYSLEQVGTVGPKTTSQLKSLYP